MKFPIRISSILCIACLYVASCSALDREAFTFTNYDLHVRLEPEQQRIGVRGKITLRNDSSSPQKLAVLQISSSLDWRSITIGGKAPQFVLHPYASDIDHTGALSEAIVTLPQDIAPHGSVDLEIGYEGVIPLDTTRLTRIGTPEDAAQSADWDQISANFTAVRGIGYVAWYPIATESANLSEDDSLDQILGRWKQREAGAMMTAAFENKDQANNGAERVICGAQEMQGTTSDGAPKVPFWQCNYDDISQSTPTFVRANYGVVNRPSITVFNLPTHAVAAESYADAAEKAVSVVTDCFGTPREKAQTVDLQDPDAAPFESGSLLLTPLASIDAQSSGLAATHQLTHAAFISFRPWIEEGLAHFTQALYVERGKGLQAVLDYMAAHRAALVQIENSTAVTEGADQTKQSLVNTTNEELYRSKAMSVWWMLRDMVGDAALKKALAQYRAGQDKDPSYMQRLIQAQTQRDLQWFFDDWVYHDRGLPDFKVESAFASKTVNGTFMVTITIGNLGWAGAEVPVTVKFATGEIATRLEVRGKSRATTRVETPMAPEEIVVNDGSVPEGDVSNNKFEFKTPEN